MKLSHVDFQTQFDLSSENFHCLVVEDPHTFAKYCEELNDGINEDSGNFCLCDNDKIFKMGKYCLMISDILNLEEDGKKMTNKIFSDLKNIADNEYLAEWYKLKQEILCFLGKINSSSLCALEYDEENDVSTLFKAFNVRLNHEGNSLLEKLVIYIKANAFYLGIKYFFFVNLKCFLRKEELLLLHKEASLSGVGIFLLENTFREKIENEKTVVVDKDLCEIVV